MLIIKYFKDYIIFNYILAAWPIFFISNQQQHPWIFVIKDTIMQICHGILIPMLFFMFNELARKHFWEELAPEWLHFLNPDRVHEVNY